jgi:hypothetical protein
MIGHIFTVSAGFLAFAIAIWRARIEVTIVRYPNTFFLLKGCRALREYILMNGIFSLTLYTLIVAAVIPAGILIPSGATAWTTAIAGAPPWIIALFVGWNTKKMLRSLLSSLRGLDTIAIMARKEENLLNQIDSFERTSVESYVRRKLLNYTGQELATIRGNVKRIIPEGGSNKKPRDRINRAKEIEDIMKICLRAVGKETFDQVFP